MRNVFSTAGLCAGDETFSFVIRGRRLQRWARYTDLSKYR